MNRDGYSSFCVTCTAADLAKSDQGAAFWKMMFVSFNVYWGKCASHFMSVIHHVYSETQMWWMHLISYKKLHLLIYRNPMSPLTENKRVWFMGSTVNINVIKTFDFLQIPLILIWSIHHCITLASYFDKSARAKNITHDLKCTYWDD